MRCYFIRDGHIAAVEALTAATDDDAIRQAERLFAERLFRDRDERFVSFEVWDRARFVYRYPIDAKTEIDLSE